MRKGGNIFSLLFYAYARIMKIVNEKMKIVNCLDLLYGSG